ncbi:MULTISPECIES: metallophosphoesterase [Chryseobacterium]|uniref:MPP superfamily phosphohydrolase n=1 Tax=Chryseobacterium camelliae TaxID=1265445 RepID=A0ABU0TEZ1_9FLAO|nr:MULTISPECIES: metallophosphoesterase [Chryseobacterium]MDT3406575.1 putative MPP superfamily phosphohydrolase [Pseudacidovorax intermedius]MDQ1095629.1 putative MPP superfamily phosphohydrolase [Chryseobacterium camelliae]MDQ1099565.1 putative MPP superfamily phosphohydrolase [Chryseobacterium sp. SORGH_AS_1048]MDR6086912.1 putative MPP superfamily phosphohydrolase [Chryseobacterium sp. SORGH_AS_0909]MDR6131286.1 putative MPP superfamily phosphohydrolase [Chryseobacterium sp. SORGH_AS_1175]
MQKNFLFIAALFLVLEVYIYQAVRTLTDNFWLRLGYWIISLAIYGVFAYEITHFQRSDRNPFRIHLMISLFLVAILPKIFIVLFLLIDDIFRTGTYLIGLTRPDEHLFPERRKFLSLLGLGLGGVLSALFIDGITFGKYRHKVRKVTVKIKNLPESFRGYKIIQISDVHSGSFSDPSKLEHAIHLINEQKPDLVLFTGDMVNNVAEEFKPFIPLFSTIKAIDGKFAVLGNHDYADYVTWNSLDAKKKNLETLIGYEKEAGFEMLRNEHRIIEKNGEKLYILGVDNWGLKPFPQFGDLDKALKNVPESAAKILMSHDPTHFDYVVKKHPGNVQLTLSGHTHGMQFGLDLKNIKWSPVQYRYPKWADLYESEGKMLYVNRGFGVLGYPGRVGVLPEITLFELA